MGTFAFRDETRRRVLSALANLRTFSASDAGSGKGLEGISGPCRRLTNVKYGALPHAYAHGLEDAAYVVYCYGTPIAWVVYEDPEDDTSRRTNYLPDWQYSATTTYYQGLVREAWGDKVVDPDPDKSRRDNRGTPRGRSSDERYGRSRSTAPRRSAADRPVSHRTSFGVDSQRADFTAQDELMDEVHGYRHPSHP